MTTGRLPDIPQSWLYIGESASFGSRPVEIQVHEKRFAVFRTESGKLAVVSANCPHMNAKLANGHVKGERIVCPFHHWEFGIDGACKHLPAQTKVPDYARIASFPTDERHGLAFMFHGAVAKFPLPFFPDSDPADFFHDKRVEIHQYGKWHIVPSNAFDAPHIVHVHNRVMEAPSVVMHPDPHCIQVRHRYRIADSTLADRVIRFFYGDRTTMTFTVWGGNFTFVVTEFGRFKNYMMTVTTPISEGESYSHIFVYSPGATRGAVYRVLRFPVLRLQSVFSKWMFRAEAESIQNIVIRPERLVETDQVLAEFTEWLHRQSGAAAAQLPVSPRSHAHAEARPAL